MSDSKGTDGNPLDKLKELEKNLAKELDHQVRLSEPSDVRLSGSVAVNPTLDATPAKPRGLDLTPGEAKTGNIILVGGTKTDSTIANLPPSSTSGGTDSRGLGHDEEMNLKDVDKLLGQLDEDFTKSMSQVKGEIGKIDAGVTLESLPLGLEYLDLKEDDELSDEVAKALKESEPVDERTPEGNKTFSRASRDLARSTVLIPLEIISKVVRQLKLLRYESPREVFLGMPSLILPLIQGWFEDLADFLRALTDISLFTYLKIFLLIVLSMGLVYFLRDISSNFRADKQTDPYLRSFGDVASEVHLVPLGGEDLGDPFRNPEFVVDVPRVIANLKTLSARSAPMISFEVYVETSTREAAVEIQERGVEVRDIMARAAEETTFDEIDSSGGKERFKGRITKKLKTILNTGRVRKVFFKELNYQR